MSRIDPFSARASLGAGLPDCYRLDVLGDLMDLAGAPVTVKILLENLLRHAGHGIVRPEDVETLASWRPGVAAEAEIPFMPSRVVLQDFTGVPAIVDLAVMRDAMAELGGDPARVNPLVPADLVIDHSVQVDRFGTPAAFAFNVDREYERNGERYQLLRWAQTAFRDLRVVPPGTGIVHQVNLEFLATVVADREADDGGRIAFPDTVVGTDSHTTMVNGLGVLGFGVGGIEAEAVLLGQPLYQPMPHVVGVRLHGKLPSGSTATDLVLRRHRAAAPARRRRVVRRVRRRRAGRAVAGRPGHDQQHEPRVRGHGHPLPDRRRDARLPPPDRALARAARARRTLCPNAGPVARAGRRPGLRRAARARSRSVDPSVAGPRRPQDRVPLTALRDNFRSSFPVGLEGPIAELGGEQPIAGNGLVEEASAESFPASDPPSFATGEAVEAAPSPATAGRNRAPGRRTALPTRWRSRSTVDVPRCIPARSRSRRSPRARTPPTRP